MHQIDLIYRNASNGSLFTTLLANQLYRNSQDGKEQFSEIEFLWLKFKELKNSVISTQEYFDEQNKLGDWDVLNSFKFSQSAYIHSISDDYDQARKCLDSSMSIDLKLFKDGKYTIMLAHYLQGILNHARLCYEESARSEFYCKVVSLVVCYLNNVKAIDKISVLVDVFGIQALNKIERSKVAKQCPKYEITETNLNNFYFSTLIALDLVRVINNKDVAKSTQRLNLASLKSKQDPSLSIFINDLIR